MDHAANEHPHEVTIIVNGREKSTEKGALTYNELVTLAFPNYTPEPNQIYTVVYYQGHSDKPKGALVEGDSIKAKEGMIFNVTGTTKS